MQNIVEGLTRDAELDANGVNRESPCLVFCLHFYLLSCTQLVSATTLARERLTVAGHNVEAIMGKDLSVLSREAVDKCVYNLCREQA